MVMAGKLLQNATARISLDRHKLNNYELFTRLFASKAVLAPVAQNTQLESL
jgi:hypothetical protein